MPRIFLSEALQTSDTASIYGEKAKYLSTVLRCTAGDDLIITDVRGVSYSARIIRLTRKTVTVKIFQALRIDTESPLQITLFQALLKGDKMDFVIQKATELGVREIIPVVTGRSQVRETRKLSRWRKIAEEASRQSGRNIIPGITDTHDFEDVFSAFRAEKGFIFWEEAGEELSHALSSGDNIRKVSLFTGPEGGFSEDEVSIASQKGFVVTSLGSRILRAETAAIAALAIVQYEWGDLGRSFASGNKTS